MVEQLERRSLFTRAQQDYLKALYLLGGDGRPVPTRDLAQRLGISSPSVSEMVTRLSAQGLVKLGGLEARGLMPGTRIAGVAGSEFEGPIDVRVKGRRESVPLGLARAIFVSEAR